ncbi:hypothetical protein C8R46DRAFT_1226912 [Mycena filopes]|nr:hypothetical protein C8R46DRAFT_1226912 [Mycena filopes]
MSRAHHYTLVHLALLNCLESVLAATISGRCAADDYLCQSTQSQKQSHESNTGVTIMGVVIGVAVFLGFAAALASCMPRVKAPATTTNVHTATGPGAAAAPRGSSESLTADTPADALPAYSAPANGILLNQFHIQHQIDMQNQMQNQINMQNQAMAASAAASNPGMTSC